MCKSELGVVSFLSYTHTYTHYLLFTCTICIYLCLFFMYICTYIVYLYMCKRNHFYIICLPLTTNISYSYTYAFATIRYFRICTEKALNICMYIQKLSLYVHLFIYLYIHTYNEMKGGSWEQGVHVLYIAYVYMRYGQSNEEESYTELGWQFWWWW